MKRQGVRGGKEEGKRGKKKGRREKEEEAERRVKVGQNPQGLKAGWE